MGERRRHADPTTEWMVHDIAQRCRDVLASLDRHATSAAHLGNAAMMLRGAADDLVSLVEMVEGGYAVGAVDGDVPPEAFGLSFGLDQPASEGRASTG